MIGDRENVHTLINAFAVTPRQQGAATAFLRRFSQSYAPSQPGFVAASVHASVDGTRAVNDVRGRSDADLAAMMPTPAAERHVAEVGRLATRADPVVYPVADVDARDHELL